MTTEDPLPDSASRMLLKARGVNKRYTQRAPFSWRSFHVDALIDVDLDLPAGSVTALVGESGSGKSTLASCIASLEKPDRGEIWFEGQLISGCDDSLLAALRPRIQMVFQDSARALNPKFTAAQIISEPLEIQRREAGPRLRSRACELMQDVGLSPDWADRHPLEFSGGQRQRSALARAIALKPDLLILDESTSGLDLSTQAQILNLLLDLQETHALTYLLVSHEFSLVQQVADFIVVMQQGRIIEHGTQAAVLGEPRHPHTRELLSSVRRVESGFMAARAGVGR